MCLVCGAEYNKAHSHRHYLCGEIVDRQLPLWAGLDGLIDWHLYTPII